jgi:hypothetical protein
MIGFTGGTAVTAVHVGYMVADMVARADFGLPIYAIALRKSEQESVVQAARGDLVRSYRGAVRRSRSSADVAAHDRRRRDEFFE